LIIAYPTAIHVYCSLSWTAAFLHKSLLMQWSVHLTTIIF
jgi:hypothetical protein